MKLSKRQSKEVLKLIQGMEFLPEQEEINRISIHFGKEKITFMVSTESSGDDSADFVMTWEDLFGYAQASSEDDLDVENITRGLRRIADDLENWGKINA